MNFTGERYLPGLGGSIALEHEHRYRFCLNLVHGNRILDIASGEGFGSAMMARTAAHVTGVDIDPEAVDHAKETYRGRNLEFLQGSCTAIPMPDASVDVVVSFETIEHHDAHEAMIAEIKRVLRPGGALVISSPDKRNYSDERNFRNEFHVKELYAEEFSALLGGQFAHVRTFLQRIVYGSAILLQEGNSEFRSFGVGTEEAIPGLKDPLYQIAIASDDPAWLPRGQSGMLEDTVYRSEALIESVTAVRSKAQTLRSRNDDLSAKAASLEDELERQTASETALRSDVARLTASETALRKQCESLTREVARLTRLYYSGTIAKRLAFHRSGLPRSWLRALLLSDKQGNSRPLTRRLLFKKSGRIRPVFEAWYTSLIPNPTNETRIDYDDFIRARIASDALAKARTLHVVTTSHTEFIGEAIKAALAATRLEITTGTKMPKVPEHDLYIVVAPQMFDSLPPLSKMILFQVEQVRASNWVEASYLDKLRQSLAVLDYSQDNIAALIDRGLTYKQLYFVPVRPITPTRKLNAQRDIDVLFYGAINSIRRSKYITALSDRVNLHVETNLFGDALGKVLDRTKVVVNIHFYENALLETTRLSEALSHGAFVVSEESSDLYEQAAFGQSVDFVPRDDVEAFVSRVEAALSDWSGPQYVRNGDDFNGMAFHLMRALHGCGVLSYAELQQCSHGLKLRGNRVVLTLPEHVERFDFARKNLLQGATFFPGLRNVDGWKGCALSYKFISAKALSQGIFPLTVYEDDACFGDGSAQRLHVIEEYLSLKKSDWDVFSGLLSDLHSEAEVLGVEYFEKEEFIHLDKVIGMVFGIYNRSALEILAAFQILGSDTAKHTIDRYLESMHLRCITTLPPLVSHHQDLRSTIWKTDDNSQVINMIESSMRRLTAKRDEFSDRADMSGAGPSGVVG